MINLSFDEIENIQKKIIEAFKKAGYPPEVMFSIFTTMIIEHFYLIKHSKEDVEGYCDLIKTNFKEFRKDNES